MPQQSPSPKNLPSDPGFVPRKEFIHEQKTIPSSFAILVISASSLVRLYSFPPSVTIALRALFGTSSSLAVFREDVQQHFCEYVLTGKPWASPKSLRAEKLLIDILAVIYQCGYTYLSSLDYGRESDDRLAMAFSKPLSSPSSNSRSTTPLPEPTSPFQQSSMSITSDKLKYRRTPFALSFLSPTRMRVIAPPLHLTPAILQAVRASWPRGVVSEKKVGNNSFEFKLKGYKWFQQDTFATDSLRHILTLLTSLDSHEFTLLSSVSMTNRSRVKDLWVFTGPGSDDVIPHESKASPPTRGESNEDMNRAHFPRTSGHHGSSTIIAQHRRLLSESTSSTANDRIQATTGQGNVPRNLIHGYRAEYLPTGPALLRKPAPRAQVPVSVVHEADPPGTDGLRAYLPSMISSDVEDMTGIGTNGFEAPQTVPPSNERSTARVLETSLSSSQHLLTPTPTHTHARSLRPVVSRQKTPPLLTFNSARSSTSSTHNMSHVGLQDRGLLGSEMFSDSAASHTTDTSFHLPIQGIETSQQSQGQFVDTMATSRRKFSPVLSGKLRPTSIEEQRGDTDDMTKLEVQHNNCVSHSNNKTPLIHEVTSHVASPELTRPDIPLRKSEAAFIGLIKDTSPAPVLPATSRVVTGTGTDSHDTGKGQGWVLVNVGESSTGTQVGFDESLDNTKRSEGAEYVPPSPQAKAIAIVDALDNKSNGKGKLSASVPVKKRFFHLGKKNPEKEEIVSGVDEPGLHKPRSGFRNRFRISSTSQSIRREKDR
ncbi:hypothetical protein C0992_003014 [Termitomyces sp. T32_za158]|nr:hypothetical protein C0992_003014 [Termitomyces sp. T32_za158]